MTWPGSLTKFQEAESEASMDRAIPFSINTCTQVLFSTYPKVASNTALW